MSSRYSYSGEGCPASSPKSSTNIISSLLNKLPVSFRKKGASGHDAVRRPEADFRSLPPTRSINNNNNNKDGEIDGRSGLPKLEGLRGGGGDAAFDRPNLVTSISEPNGFVSVRFQSSMPGDLREKKNNFFPGVGRGKEGV